MIFLVLLVKFMSVDANVMFLCGLFNDAVSSPDYVTLDDGMNNEWERLWKETVMGKFSEFSWQLLD
jgi:hypothetical protein